MDTKSQNIHFLRILTHIGKNGLVDTDNFVLRSMKTFKAVAALIFGYVVWLDQDTVIFIPTLTTIHRAKSGS
jgi:hypothetical protein